MDQIINHFLGFMIPDQKCKSDQNSKILVSSCSVYGLDQTPFTPTPNNPPKIQSCLPSQHQGLLKEKKSSAPKNCLPRVNEDELESTYVNQS